MKLLIQIHNNGHSRTVADKLNLLGILINILATATSVILYILSH